MLNLKAAFTALAVAGLFSAPSAFAKVTPVSMSVEYDTADLGTAAGASALLKTISLEAKNACTSYMPVSAIRYVDQSCKAELETDAKSKIIESAEAAGLAIAPVFTESANLKVALND